MNVFIVNVDRTQIDFEAGERTTFREVRDVAAKEFNAIAQNVCLTHKGKIYNADELDLELSVCGVAQDDPIEVTLPPGAMARTLIDAEPELNGMTAEAFIQMYLSERGRKYKTQKWLQLFKDSKGNAWNEEDNWHWSGLHNKAFAFPERIKHVIQIGYTSRAFRRELARVFSSNRIDMASDEFVEMAIDACDTFTGMYTPMIQAIKRGSVPLVRKAFARTAYDRVTADDMKHVLMNPSLEVLQVFLEENFCWATVGIAECMNPAYIRSHGPLLRKHLKGEDVNEAITVVNKVLLRKACGHTDIEGFRFLLQWCADDTDSIHLKPTNGAAVVAAARNPDPRFLKELLKAGVTAKTTTKDVPIVEAAKKGLTSNVETLLDAGIPLYRSLLGTALQLGNTSLVTLLIDRGADVNAHKSNGATNLQLAVSSSPAFVPLLLELGSEANKVSLKERRTPLELAAGNGACSVIAALLSHGADAGVGNPLKWAVRSGCEDAAKMLLTLDTNFQPALEKAIIMGQDTLASVFPVDTETPFLKQFMKACSHSRLLIHLLNRRPKEAASIVTMRDEKGRTVFHAVAARMKDDPEPVLKKLLELGADPSIGNATLAFIRKSYPKCVKLLIANGKITVTPEMIFKAVRMHETHGSLGDLLTTMGSVPHGVITYILKRGCLRCVRALHESNVAKLHNYIPEILSGKKLDTLERSKWLSVLLPNKEGSDNDRILLAALRHKIHMSEEVREKLCPGSNSLKIAIDSRITYNHVTWLLTAKCSDLDKGLRAAVRIKAHKITTMVLLKGAKVTTELLHRALTGETKQCYLYHTHGTVKAMLGSAPHLVNATNEDGKTLLQRSIELNIICVANWLATYKTIDVNLGSPLHIAIKHRFDYVAKSLLTRVTDINARDVNGDTALHVFFKRRLQSRSTSLLQDILRCDPDLSLKGSTGETPFWTAANLSYFEMVQLINAGCPLDPAVDNSGGLTPLMALCSRQSPKNTIKCITNLAVIQNLESRINATDDEGWDAGDYVEMRCKKRAHTGVTIDELHSLGLRKKRKSAAC